MNEHDFERHPIYCPVCGAENPGELYKIVNEDEWFGCNECLWDSLDVILPDDLDDADIEALSEE